MDDDNVERRYTQIQVRDIILRTPIDTDIKRLFTLSLYFQIPRDCQSRNNKTPNGVFHKRDFSPSFSHFYPASAIAISTAGPR